MKQSNLILLILFTIILGCKKDIKNNDLTKRDSGIPENFFAILKTPGIVYEGGGY